MASTYLTAGTMGSVTNRKKFTISFWIKRGSLGEEYMWQSYNASSLTSYRLQIDFQSDDKFEIRGVDGSSQHTRLVTNRQFKDTNAWYHIYCVFDSTQGTASNRVKIYVNGEQQTSLATSTYPNQNVDFAVGVDGSINYTLDIGRWGGGSNYWSGSMSHFYYVDGSVIAHTQFGSTDTTTGEWKINTNPTIASYGNKGFLVLKDGNTVTDQSPNSNNLTVGGGTLTKTEDNPSNVFATGNPLAQLSVGTLSNGNNTITGSNTTNYYGFISSTIGMSLGKWYAEFKKISGNAGIDIGISDNPNSSGVDAGDYLGQGAYQWSYDGGSGNIRNNASSSSYGNSYTDGDIIGVALDLDNNKLYFSKNGTWQNSGDPTSGATGTGAISITALTSTNTGVYHFAFGDNSGSSFGVVSANFGNGYFGTTAVASAGTNASGIGIFEYNVPAGYTALSTKGLNL